MAGMRRRTGNGLVMAAVAVMPTVLVTGAVALVVTVALIFVVAVTVAAAVAVNAGVAFAVTTALGVGMTVGQAKMRRMAVDRTVGVAVAVTVAVTVATDWLSAPLDVGPSRKTVRVMKAMHRLRTDNGCFTGLSFEKRPARFSETWQVSEWADVTGSSGGLCHC
jgi:hypothetical protein